MEHFVPSIKLLSDKPMVYDVGKVDQHIVLHNFL